MTEEKDAKPSKRHRAEHLNHPPHFITAIVPFYNEERTIIQVVQKLLQNPLIDEIICVNDASTDESVQKLRRFAHKIKIINLKKNKGKGYALVQGIKNAKGNIVAFFDADLIRFKNDHINELLMPILNKEARAVVGFKMPKKHRILASLTKNLAGERVYYKEDLLPYLNSMAKTRFGIEMFLNKHFKRKKVKKIPLIGLGHLYKHEKYEPQEAVTETIREVVEIAQEIGKTEVDLPQQYKSAKRYVIQYLLPINIIKNIIRSNFLLFILIGTFSMITLISLAAFYKPAYFSENITKGAFLLALKEDMVRVTPYLKRFIP